MKKIFVIDRILFFVFILLASSGIGLYIAGHGNNHEPQHNRVVLHVLGSFLFLITVVSHITTYRGWYKGAVRNELGKKSKITAVLSVVFFLVSATGVILLGVNGTNSDTGLLYCKMGTATIILCIGHILKRTHLLCKSLRQ